MENFLATSKNSQVEGLVIVDLDWIGDLHVKFWLMLTSRRKQTKALWQSFFLWQSSYVVCMFHISVYGVVSCKLIF
ncbi:hypothetical protein Bca52824_020650 [Brassica carinata]|uniref:Uncharacterized protein n=1 Tax=Brassica carinata TaxID=52824 RepID=A0A8X8B0T3_BRACI|nr:hypothetical protein Bca52824_020650 [Brassica carinata]